MIPLKPEMGSLEDGEKMFLKNAKYLIRHFCEEKTIAETFVGNVFKRDSMALILKTVCVRKTFWGATSELSTCQTT